MLTKATPGGEVAARAEAVRVWRTYLSQCSRIGTLVVALVIGGCDSPTEPPPLDPEVLAGAALLLVSGDEQEGVVGRPLAERLVTLVVDAAGAPLAGAPVTWTFRAGRGGDRGARSTVVTLTSDAAGIVDTEWELGTTAGTQVAWAEVGTESTVRPDATPSAPPENGDSRARARRVGFRAKVDPAEPAEILVSHTSLELTEGESLLITAVVVDQYGNEIPEAEVTWSSSDPSIATVGTPSTAPALRLAAVSDKTMGSQKATARGRAAAAE